MPLVCKWILSLLLITSPLTAQSRTSHRERVVATVNGTEITAAELQFDFFEKQLSPGTVKLSEPELIEQLVDRELIRQFLEKQNVTADRILLEQRLNLVRRMVEKKGDDLSQVLLGVGLDEASLERILALHIAWRTFVTQLLTEARINEYWQSHQFQFDGTEVRAAQIFKKIDATMTAAEISQIVQALTKLQQEIELGKLTFAEAAKMYSQSPSGKNGGDLGTFEYFGRVAEPIARAAFETEVGKISAPFQSEYGVHIVTVSQRSAGDLSLEDARPGVMRALADVLWKEQVQHERKTARIQILPLK